MIFFGGGITYIPSGFPAVEPESFGGLVEFLAEGFVGVVQEDVQGAAGFFPGRWKVCEWIQGGPVGNHSSFDGGAGGAVGSDS